MSFLKVKGIHYSIKDTPVLRDVSFSQRQFQKIALAGETGSGKSSLLKIIAGLEPPDKGVVTFEGAIVEGPEARLVPGHREIAYLSQHYELAKFLTVAQVLAYANTLSKEEAGRVYEICQINHLLERKTNQLSGGERQRIALARLIISWPKLLLLDEPFSNLDMAHKNTLKAVIKDLSDELGITCLLISHDPVDLLSWADEIIVLKHGVITQKGTPDIIYNNPVDEYVAGLFGKFNLTPASLRKAGKNTDTLQISRPEDFTVSEKPGKGAIKGIIKGVTFMGSYHELQVGIWETSILVNSRINNYKIGDIVYISHT